MPQQPEKLQLKSGIKLTVPKVKLNEPYLKHPSYKPDPNALQKITEEPTDSPIPTKNSANNEITFKPNSSSSHTPNANPLFNPENLCKVIQNAESFDKIFQELINEGYIDKDLHDKSKILNEKIIQDTKTLHKHFEDPNQLKGNKYDHLRTTGNEKDNSILTELVNNGNNDVKITQGLGFHQEVAAFTTMIPENGKTSKPVSRYYISLSLALFLSVMINRCPRV